MKRKEDRPEFYATKVRAMEVTPANIGHAKGNPCVVLTVGKPDLSVEQMVFPIMDAKLIAAKMLVALATYDDELAQKILKEHFVGDENGEYVWPTSPPL